MPCKTDIKPLLEAIRRDRDRVLVGATKAVSDWGHFVISEAQIITPIELGNLRNSGKPEEPFVSGNRVSCKYGFNAVYAAAVHERLDLRHAPPTQAKYLESTIRRLEPQFPTFVARRLREARNG